MVETDAIVEQQEESPTTIVAGDTLSAFVSEKQTKANETAAEAQKLINLYRQLNVLGTDYVTIFDKVLLASTPDVQLALSNLSSGDQVRQYLKFLQNRMAKTETIDELESETNSILEDASSYLPDADEVAPYHMATPTVHVEGQGTISAAPTMDPEFLSAVLKSVTESQQQSIAQQNEFLKQALFRMQETIATHNPNTPAVTASFDYDRFSEIQQNTLNETIARITTEQAKLLNESLSEVLRNTQEIAQEQVHSIGEMISANVMANGSYPDINDYLERPSDRRSKNLKDEPAEKITDDFEPVEMLHVEMPDFDEPAHTPVVQNKTEQPVVQPEPIVSPKQNIESTPTDAPEEFEILSEIDLPNDDMI